MLQGNDLSTYQEQKIIVVLEGVLTNVTTTRIRGKINNPDMWVWNIMGIKSIVAKHRGNVTVDVVTFMGQEVADMAAEWFLFYDVPAGSMEAVDFDHFCSSLVWRNDVHTVVDSDPDRLMKYGQKGYATPVGNTF